MYDRIRSPSRNIFKIGNYSRFRNWVFNRTSNVYYWFALCCLLSGNVQAINWAVNDDFWGYYVWPSSYTYQGVNVLGLYVHHQAGSSFCTTEYKGNQDIQGPNFNCKYPTQIVPIQFDNGTETFEIVWQNSPLKFTINITAKNNTNTEKGFYFQNGQVTLIDPWQTKTVSNVLPSPTNQYNLNIYTSLGLYGYATIEQYFTGTKYFNITIGNSTPPDPIENEIPPSNPPPNPVDPVVPIDPVIPISDPIDSTQIITPDINIPTPDSDTFKKALNESGSSVSLGGGTISGLDTSNQANLGTFFSQVQRLYYNVIEYVKIPKTFINKISQTLLPDVNSKSYSFNFGTFMGKSFDISWAKYSNQLDNVRNFFKYFLYFILIFNLYKMARYLIGGQ